MDTPQDSNLVDIDDLKRHLQQHLSDDLVTIVGSGLSCAEGLPGMGELATLIADHIRTSANTTLIDEWSAVAGLVASDGLEAALLKAPPSAALETAICAATAAAITSRERAVIERLLAEEGILPLARLMQVLLKPKAGLPVITTNYDRLVEIAAESCGLGVDSGFVGEIFGEFNPRESRMSLCRSVAFRARNRPPELVYKKSVTVFKPHGSIDWYLHGGKPIRHGASLLAPRLMITPGRNKFRNGYDSPFDAHRERANKAIDAAKRFLIIGYGFNDDHLETHLMPAIRAGTPTLILTRNLSDTARALAGSTPTVTAMEFCSDGGAAGARLFRNAGQYFLPEISWWNLESFVTEVLNP